MPKGKQNQEKFIENLNLGIFDNTVDKDSQGSQGSSQQDSTPDPAPSPPSPSSEIQDKGSTETIILETQSAEEREIIQPSEILERPQSGLQRFFYDMFETEFSNGVIIGMIAALGCCVCCATCCFVGCLMLFCDSYKLKRRKIVDEIKKQEEFVPEWKR